jgi:hypothetical protein
VDNLLTRSRLGELELIDETKARAEFIRGAAIIPAAGLVLGVFSIAILLILPAI